MPKPEQYTRNIEKILAEPKINKTNLEVLKKYDTRGKLQQLTLGTRSGRLMTIKQVALFIPKDFKTMTKEDIEDFFSSLGELQPKTWSTKGAFIKSFFKWLHESDQYPDNVRWINTSVKNKNHKLPSDLLTKEEIKAMAELAGNLSDRAFILVLYDSACRIGEILNLKIKDVTVDQYGCAITVNGKTGMRRIRLIDSSPDLVMWINNHPEKQNRDAPLFIHLSDKNRYHVFGKALSDYSIRTLLKKLSRIAGIKKRVHPHLFRHSRLTELAKEFTESELKIIAGWTGSSTMAGVYVHLSGGDIEKKMLEKNGLIDKTDNPEKDILKPKECPRCKEINPNTAKFCNICGMALELLAVIEVESKKPIEPQTDDVLSKELLQYVIKKNPELVFDFLKENGMDDLHSLVAPQTTAKIKAPVLLG
ncbi:MAG: tyrosine-type recombinase/integrase [Candidatus Omnitrophica bacterium]|nr:tyrosine-type recombinase/integrase [Candidatus Omnitrophota bacterium]